MTVIIGLVVLLGCVFGGYLVAGGKLGPILYALPFELLIIGGAAAGAFVMSQSMSAVKHTLAGIMSTLRGARHRQADYLELCTLLHRLLRLAQAKGAAGVEPHIENPAESSIFTAHPRVAANHHAVALICDYMRMIGMDANDPHQVEDMMSAELRKIREEELHPAHALQSMADALPALGIVAAVLGVIKTMGSIDQPPAVLGAMIGSALVGTFLGVLLAYGMVGPLATRLKSIVEQDAQFLEVIRATLVCYLHGNPPPVAVEAGRKVVPSDLMPSFSMLDAALQAAR